MTWLFNISLGLLISLLVVGFAADAVWEYRKWRWHCMAIDSDVDIVFYEDRLILLPPGGPKKGGGK